MGVPFFYKWLKNTRRGVLRRGVPTNVSSLSLDYNGIIHETAQQVYAYGEGENPKLAEMVRKSDPKMLEVEHHKSISSKLSSIIESVRPRDSLVLGVDGVAPQAKIAQQRQRRYKAVMMSGSGPKAFDSNCITPGTEYMMRLDSFMQRWLIANNGIFPGKVVYSSHMCPGEGEHKIMDLFRSGEISGEGVHVIYGMDADLIMLSLLAPVENIFLMREDINDVIDIEALKRTIYEDLGTDTAIEDFVVMLYLLGNDFLPHMPAFSDLEETIETMIRVYKATGEPLTQVREREVEESDEEEEDDEKEDEEKEDEEEEEEKEKEIREEKDLYWPGLVKFITNLAKEEETLLKNESMREAKYPSRMMEMAIKRTDVFNVGKVSEKVTRDISFDYGVFRSAWYDNAFRNKGDQSVFEKLFPGHAFGATNEKIVAMTRDYLTGISWVYRYYNTGRKGINDGYVYKYHYSPLLSDVALVASQFTVPDKSYFFDKNAPSINPVHQLLAVIPLKSKGLVPEEVKHLMAPDSPIADLFPLEAPIERDGVNNEWQGIILVNFANMKRIIDAVETGTSFSEKRIRMFSEVYNVVLKKEKSETEMLAGVQKFRQFLTAEANKGRGRGRGSRQQGGQYGSQQAQQSGGRGGYRSQWYKAEDSSAQTQPQGQGYQGGRGYQGQGRGRGGYQGKQGQYGGQRKDQGGRGYQGQGRGRGYGGRGGQGGRGYIPTTQVPPPVPTAKFPPPPKTSQSQTTSKLSEPVTKVKLGLPPLAVRPKVLESKPVERFEL